MGDGCVNVYKQRKRGSNMATFQRVQKTHKANREGRSNGYCASCGMMMMYSDACCPKCQGVEVVMEAPECKVGSRGGSKHNYSVASADKGGVRPVK